MDGLTDHITERVWTDTVTTGYTLPDRAYQRLITHALAKKLGRSSL